MNISSIVNDIQLLHHNSIIQWKEQGINLTQHNFLRLVEENHSFNYQLWNAEDRARRDDCGADFVYQAKREIDYFNQQRNDRMEMIDSWLWNNLQPSQIPTVTLHSETPGMMIDRLSIIALKSYHMQLQTIRKNVTPDHIAMCQQKLQIIQEQLHNLANCLQQLLLEIQNQTRTFKIYHQMKMYNNPQFREEVSA